MKLKSLKQIGQGAFSKVYLVKDLISGKYYATKEVETAKMNEAMQQRKIHEKLREKAFKRFLDEVAYEENQMVDELRGILRAKGFRELYGFVNCYLWRDSFPAL